MRKWYRTRRFWVIAMIIVVLVAVFLAGGNIVQCFRLRRDIKVLEREIERYRVRIEADSTMLENLKYDEYVEAYAREHYHLQKRNETVYIIEKD